MKVWLYYRLSRDEDAELNSLNNQRNILVEYAKANNHDIIGESFDDNVSGMHFNREGINKIYEEDIENAVLQWKQQKQNQAGDDTVKRLMANTPADTMRRAAYLAYILSHYDNDHM